MNPAVQNITFFTTKSSGGEDINYRKSDAVRILEWLSQVGGFLYALDIIFGVIVKWYNHRLYVFHLAAGRYLTRKNVGLDGADYDKIDM